VARPAGWEVAAGTAVGKLRRSLPSCSTAVHVPARRSSAAGAASHPSLPRANMPRRCNAACSVMLSKLLLGFKGDEACQLRLLFPARGPSGDAVPPSKAARAAEP
jgi:hypothetical protein